MKLTEERIKNAAQELNEVLGLEPEIDLEQDLKELKEELLVAADLVEPDDELSNDTMEVVEALQKSGGVEEEEATAHEYDEEPDEEEEIEEPLDDEEEEEAPPEPPQPQKQPDHATKVVELKAKEKPKEKPKAKPLTSSPSEITRLHAAGLAIKEEQGKGKTVPELIEKADQIYVKAGGGPNLKESGEAVRKALQALVAFGAVRIKEEKGTIE